MTAWLCTAAIVALGFGSIAVVCVVHEVRVRRHRAWREDLLRKDRP